MLSKQEYLDIIDFIQFFYVQNFEATAQVRSLKTERLQKEDENNLSNKLALLSEVINEHFELKENHTALSLAFDNLYDLLYRPKPYKFEDLKPNMWVWDDNRQSVIKVIGFYGINIHVQFGIGVYKKDCYIEFEENRFYPVTKAMEEFKMLNKEEYLTYLEYGVKPGPTIYDSFKELIEKYFEIEAKQTPQKVICINKHGEDIDYKNVDLLKCPNCGRRLRNKQHDPYCPKCGQKLDWSEADD